MTDRAQQLYAVSERRACRVLHQPRATQRYDSVKDDQAKLRGRIKEIAGGHVTWGYQSALNDGPCSMDGVVDWMLIQALPILTRVCCTHLNGNPVVQSSMQGDLSIILQNILDASREFSSYICFRSQSPSVMIALVPISSRERTASSAI